jgi:hypothetical protein
VYRGGCRGCRMQGCVENLCASSLLSFNGNTYASAELGTRRGPGRSAGLVARTRAHPGGVVGALVGAADGRRLGRGDGSNERD